MQDYLFGYGSLMNATSASRAVGRSLSLNDLVPTWVSSYQRSWSLKEQVFSETLGRPITGVFLDLRAVADGHVNGVLIAVSNTELANLRIREKNYDCVDITARVDFRGTLAARAGARILTFLAKPEQKVLPHSSEELYVMGRYIDMVETACREIGEEFLREYWSTTEEVRFPIIDGIYTFIDPAQAKYV